MMTIKQRNPCFCEYVEVEDKNMINYDGSHLWIVILINECVFCMPEIDAANSTGIMA